MINHFFYKEIKDNKYGISLVELLLSISILGIVLSMGYSILFFTYETFHSGERSSDVRQNVRFVTTFITNELRGATHVEIFAADDFNIENGLPDVFGDESSDIYGFIYIDIYLDDNNNEYKALHHKKPGRGGLGEVVFRDITKGVNLQLEFDLSDTGFLKYGIVEDNNNAYIINSGLQFLNFGYGKFIYPSSEQGVAIAYTTKRSLGWNTVVTDLWYMDLMENESLGVNHEDYCENKAKDKELFDFEREEAGLALYETTIKTKIWNEMKKTSYNFEIHPFITNNSIHITGTQEGRGAYFAVDVERYVKDIDNYTVRFDSRLRRGVHGDFTYHTQGWGIVLNSVFTETGGDAGYMYQFDPGAQGFVVRRNDFNGSHSSGIVEMGVYEDGAVYDNNIEATYKPSKVNNNNFNWTGDDDNTNDRWLKDYTSEITVQRQIDGSIILRTRIWETDRGRENMAEEMWFGDFGEITYNGHTFKGYKADPNNNKSLYEFPNSAGGTYLGFRSWGGRYYAEFNHLHLTDGFDPLRIQDAKFLVWEGEIEGSNVQLADTIQVTFRDNIRGREDNLVEDSSLFEIEIDGILRDIYSWEVVEGNQLLITLFDVFENPLLNELLPNNTVAPDKISSVTIKRGGVRHVHAGDVTISNGLNFRILGYGEADTKPIFKELAIRPDILEDGIIDEKYSHTFVALGGAEPYSYSAEGLPEGFILDSETGEISGSTDIANTRADFTIIVEDNNSNEASHDFPFKVNLSNEWNWMLNSGKVEVLEGVDGIQLTSPVTLNSNNLWERGWLTMKENQVPQNIVFNWYSDRTHSSWSDMRIKFLANGSLNNSASWSQTGYQIQWEVWNSDEGYAPIVLYRLDGSSSTELGRFNLNLSEANEWHTMRIDVTHTHLRVLHNGVEIIASNDSNYRGVGQFILGVRERGGSTRYKNIKINDNDISWKQ